MVHVHACLELEPRASVRVLQPPRGCLSCHTVVVPFQNATYSELLWFYMPYSRAAGTMMQVTQDALL